MRGDAGAVAGLFYFRNSANESDIEILTRDQTSEIRYSNQPVVDQGLSLSALVVLLLLLLLTSSARGQ